MDRSTRAVPRWVIQGAHEYTVRCAKELAIKHGYRIAEIVDIAIYQLYANPDRLEGTAKILGPIHER